MDLDLTGKRALVTGASQGIGAAVARQLAAEGCDLFLTARNADNLGTVQAALQSDYGVEAEILPLDLSGPGAVGTLAAAAGDIDILVNNAGAIPAGRLSDIGEDQWRAVWEVKLFGYINLTRALYGSMKARGGGVIVNICGASGERPKSNYICGATANTALMSFSMALGGDSMMDGIRVVAVNPGPVATERLVNLTRASAAEKLGDEDRWQELWSALPEGRAATVEEIADAVAFLASPRSAYTSGTVVTVDGGYCNRGSLM
jgi:NAD(P)-dependent dehydrogenase (short-subunit alcohol dehydrogenase family)